MSLSSGAFPYDIDNLLGGAVRILMADSDQALPANIADVINMETPYAAKSGWTDLGATKESFTYSRSFDTSGWEIQQLAGNVIEEITDITRTIQISFAEFKPEHLQLIEGAPSIATITAAAHKSAQKKVAFGSFESLTQYRFAFISRRSKQSGIVTEAASGTTRGRFFMGVAYLAQLTADSVDMEQNKGDLSAVGVTWKLFPDTDEDQGEEFGAWFDEEAGTIANS